MHDSSRHAGRFSAILALLRNLIAASLLYGLIFGVILAVKAPSQGMKGKLGIPSELDKTGPADIIKTTKSGVQVKFAASSSSVTINPHANVFNRPASLTIAKDDYLGPRPHVDTEADLQILVNECRGTYNGMEKVKNIYDCMKFLADDEERYYRVPKHNRASQRDPQQSEYLNSEAIQDTRQSYPAEKDAKPVSKGSIGTCAGPIIPYHTYWYGTATWRLEVFIKSYLYTQNLACSRLYIWIDEDRNPLAVKLMLEKDPMFARFLQLVQRGDIVVKSWTFPSRIPFTKYDDNFEGMGYYKTPSKPNLKGESTVAEGIIEDANGQQWMLVSPKQRTYLPQSVSDAARFIILHLYGGVFFEVDVLMLRDMRPLLLPEKHSFVGRWAAYLHPGDFHTGVMSLSANSSLSSYLLRGGIRMGLNFHPRVIGRMAWKDGRDTELTMLETAAFDPLWTEATWGREGRCTVPCLRDYSAAFKGKATVVKDEWESYDGPQAQLIDLNNPPPSPKRPIETKQKSTTQFDDRSVSILPQGPPRQQRRLQMRDNLNAPPSKESTSSFATTNDEEAELRRAGAIADYHIDEDKFPPNNRTLEHFYKGAWSYHVHNQWLKHPEPSSWLSVIEHAHDGFFAGTRTNMYGETWDGPDLSPYNYWPEFV